LLLVSSEHSGSTYEPHRSIDRADPLETAPPSLSLEEVERISERVFGRGGRVEALDSERDQNFRLRSTDGESFLLKISNPADDVAAIEMQTEAMLHIKRQAPVLPVMQPLPAMDGSLISGVQAEVDQRLLVRLFSFLPGRMLASADLNHGAIQDFGAMVARMGLALRGFFHPAAGYKILWDLKNTSELRPMLNAVADPSQRDIAELVLDRFDGGVAPQLSGLRAQPIHNDLTLDNVLLDDGHRVSGIVDFGDLTHTALICDLAIALVSLMWGRSDPVETAEGAIAGYNSVLPIEQDEAELLADLVAARLTALVLIAAWRVRRYPENSDYITANVDLAWALLKRFDALGFEAIKERMRTACTHAAGHAADAKQPSKNELLDRRKRVLGPALSPLSYREPLYLVRGRGSKMFDERGIAYIDAYNNVPVVGHSHPHVAAAIAEQSRALNTNTRYLHESVIELAERLVATMPAGLDTVMFVNSGSEANDIAWRLAVAYTGGAGGIVTSRAYHGVTTATIALSPEEWVEGESPAHIERIPPPEDGGQQLGREYADHVSDAIAKLNERGFPPAACYVDPIFTSDGIFTPPPSLLNELHRRLEDGGCLLVADEVQCGFGRIGSHLWSFRASGITPDFVTLGKPMGNGHPVAAVITRREIADRFAEKTDMFSTFGGNPVACRAALAVLNVIEREGLMARTIDVGDRLRSGLSGLMNHHESIADVRGAGLMIGVELVNIGPRTPAPELTDEVINRMKDRGVLVGITGPHANVIKIRPPLVLAPDEADAIVAALDESLSELAPD
jgi:4-aminobutyrate aminotransferase-like enzyme/Ser/Thr protein kinase RdoA (MazF antagonist)